MRRRRYASHIPCLTRLDFGSSWQVLALYCPLLCDSPKDTDFPLLDIGEGVNERLHFSHVLYLKGVKLDMNHDNLNSGLVKRRRVLGRQSTKGIGVTGSEVDGTWDDNINCNGK